MKKHVKKSSGKWQPFCLSLHVLKKKDTSDGISQVHSWSWSMLIGLCHHDGCRWPGTNRCQDISNHHAYSTVDTVSHATYQAAKTPNKLYLREIRRPITSYQYRKSHCGDKTILRASYPHNGISYTGITTSLYWIRSLVSLLLACSSSHSKHKVYIQA